MQHEITTSGPLLDGSGNLREPGYAKRLLPIYRRADIKAPASRIKEWDYYLVANDHFAVALTIDDNGYMGLDSISFLHFNEGWERTKSPMRAFPMGKTGLPESSDRGTTAISGRGYALVFRHVPEGRELTFHMEKFLDGQTIDGSIVLTEEPEESMVICTPFDRPGCFYFNQKINCMRARGQVQLGEKTYVFDPADSFGVLDWGRGVWTYHNTWYWGSASGQVEAQPCSGMGLVGGVQSCPHDFRGNVRGIAQAPRTWWKLHQGNYCAEISGNGFLGAGGCQEK